MLFGISGAVVNAVHPLNVLVKLVTLFGIFGAFTNAVHPKKVFVISVTLFGIFSLNSVIPQPLFKSNPLYPNYIGCVFVPSIYLLPTIPLPSPYPLLISSFYFPALWKGGGKAKICTR